MNPVIPDSISSRLAGISGAITGAGEKAKETTTNTVLSAKTFSDAITPWGNSKAIAFNVQDSIQTSMQTWVDAHPILSWVLLHPIWSVVIAIAAFWLISSLLKALGYLAVQLGLSILKLPSAGFKALLSRNPKTDKQQQLAEILDRLEALRQEQDDLLQQVKTILASDRD